MYCPLLMLVLHVADEPIPFARDIRIGAAVGIIAIVSAARSSAAIDERNCPKPPTSKSGILSILHASRYK
jgi:hypothetical protein